VGSLQKGLGFAGAGQLDAAAAQLAVALERSPDFIEARFILGEALSQKGATHEASAQYRELLHRRPDHTGARVILRSNSSGRATSWTPRPISRRPCVATRPSFRLIQLAYVFLKTGRAAEAAREYRAVLWLDPSHLQAMIGLADALAGTRSRRPSLGIGKVLEIDPGQHQVQRRLQALESAARFRIDHGGARRVKNPASLRCRDWLLLPEGSDEDLGQEQ